MHLCMRLLCCVLMAAPLGIQAKPLPANAPVRGWTLLSKDERIALATIAAAPTYDINRLELSHELIYDLRDIKKEPRRRAINRLIDVAHDAGIAEVSVWDHALYDLDYYPKEFRTGPANTLDFDNPKFWAWFKADYRAMLDRIPNVDAVTLTFIETGARAEQQFSNELTTAPERLAAVVNAVADVVIGERHMNLYARTFSYTYAEYANILKAVEHFSRAGIRLMMKETPHDFFLTHPNDLYAGTVARPTLIEFDAAGEFNGQSIVAGTWPEYILRRWRDFARRPHVIGYTARTDRYGDTQLVGRPEEINLYALKRATEDKQVTAEQIYDEFIAVRYGQAAVPGLKAAFKSAYGIVSSTLYTLGTNIASHSLLNYEPDVLNVYARSSYVLHVSGKWLDPPIAYVAHGVDREFHYWRDVIDRLAPPAIKAHNNPQWEEVQNVIKAGWIHPEERMDEEYLRYIVTEKNHGVALAEGAARHIETARRVLKPADYEQLRHHFQHTLLTARLHRAVASAYFGARVAKRGEKYRSAFVAATIRSGEAEVRQVAKLVRDYPVKPPTGQWDWVKDAEQAERHLNPNMNARKSKTNSSKN